MVVESTGVDGRLQLNVQSLVSVQASGLRDHAHDHVPARWSGTMRDRTPIGAVTFNPERDSVVAANAKQN